MNALNYVCATLLVAFSLAACSTTANPSSIPVEPPDLDVGETLSDIPLENLAFSNALGRSMNFGNALEAPREGDWGIRLEEAYFETIKKAGFKTIRLPVSWTHYAGKSAPYTISPTIFSRVDWAIEQATKRGMNIIVNVHHYDELNANPTKEGARYIAMWKQIAERYKSEGSDVYFELLNEPHGAFDANPELWNTLLLQAYQEVRKTNPNRKLIIGPVNYNSIDSLSSLRLPKDANIIATVHFYDPFPFTHQGPNFDGSPGGLPTGVTWRSKQKSFAWEDWSWDSKLTWATNKNGNDYVDTTFQKGYAGLYLRTNTAVTGYNRLRFKTATALKLNILCGDKAKPLTTTTGWRTYLVDLSDCGALDSIIIQSDSPNPQATFRMYRLKLLGANGKTLELMPTATEALGQSLDKALAWSKANNYPIFLGEFGVRDTADMASRAAWTAAVRQAMEARGITWAYWEFGSEFGAYDISKKAWRPELLKALIP